MGKYGKKNIVSDELTKYSILLLGESGIGKTTTMYEMCEKLAGEDGYLILNTGKEDGVACIDGVIYENVENWKKFDEVTKDIIKNKSTDYPNLKIIVIDTIDQLFNITEPEVIRRYNTEKMGEKNFKSINTINAAYGGFGAGLDKVEELILDKIWELKKAGLAVWMCGHVKVKDVIDPVTDQTYSTLSALLSQRYFNAIKTKVHVVGMAVIDRSIATEGTGRKNIVTKEEITRNKIQSETRKIVFRDDNYGVDSKSRFRYIINEIPLNSDAFIQALRDAIVEEKKHRKADSVTVNSKTVVEKSIPVKVEDEEDFPMNHPEEPEDFDEEVPFDEENTMSDDDMRTEIRNKMKLASEDIKTSVKNVLKSYGTKLNDASHDILIELVNILS